MHPLRPTLTDYMALTDYLVSIEKRPDRAQMERAFVAAFQVARDSISNIVHRIYLDAGVEKRRAHLLSVEGARALERAAFLIAEEFDRRADAAITENDPRLNAA